MEPITIIVDALAAGAKAGLTDTAAQPIKDAYTGLKSLIQRKHAQAGASVDMLESDPGSKDLQSYVEEQLAKTNAAQDSELLQQAQATRDTVAKYDPEVARTFGIILRDIKAASLDLANVKATGTGPMTVVQVEKADIGGRIKIEGVHVGSQAANPLAAPPTSLVNATQAGMAVPAVTLNDVAAGGDIELVLGTVEQQAPIAPTLAEAPPPPSHFVGRRQRIDEIKKLLTSANASASVGIQGMGGIGKSTLVLKAAEELSSEFPGGIFWASLPDNDGTAEPILRDWALRCGYERTSKLEGAALSGQVRGLLKQRQNQQGKVLIVVDDIRTEWIDEARLVKESLPTDTPFLFTTRNEDIATALGEVVLNLESLSKEEALTLLKNLGGATIVECDIETAEKLLNLVGYLPLAIELLGKHLVVQRRKPGYQLKDLYLLIEAGMITRLELPGYPSLAATLAVSYNALTPMTQQTFRWLAVFDAPLLIKTLIAEVMRSDVSAVEGSLDDLVNASMLSYGDRQGFFRLHPLLLQYALALLRAAGEERSAQDAYEISFKESKPLSVVYHRSPRISLQDTERYIVFSDHQKGMRDTADDFRPCESTYLAALNYYYDLGYKLVILGDAEDFWENSIAPVLQAYSNVFQTEARFYPNRYLRIVGSHDDAWRSPDLVKKYLEPYFPGIQVHEGLVLEYQEATSKASNIFLTHGHQGVRPEKIGGLTTWFVGTFWRPIQRLLSIRQTSASSNWELREQYELMMYSWAARQNALVLIGGYSHHPVWESMGFEEAMEAMQATASRSQSDETGIQGRVAGEMAVSSKKPCYFNVGSCSLSDRSCTGVELGDGEIRLVRWHDGTQSARDVLFSRGLGDVLRAVR